MISLKIPLHTSAHVLGEGGFVLLARRFVDGPYSLGSATLVSVRGLHLTLPRHDSKSRGRARTKVRTSKCDVTPVGAVRTN